MHFLCDNTEESICFFVNLGIKKLREVCNFTKKIPWQEKSIY